ncbi:MAG: tetratricopeptide repeat protein [Methanoregula sp.]|nr:tetratricopeptide repeat protein [Methanoregula sp.]
MRLVLFIDDEELLLDATKSFLERFGNMKVQTATSAKEALQVLMNNTFDALVIDYYLPEINGIELLKILRAKGDTTPIIIFTGVGRENAAIEALNGGADFFLKKGESPSSEFRELVRMINLAVDRHLLERPFGVAQKILADTISFFPDAAYVIDRDGIVIAWNKEMANLTGIDQKDIIGKGDGSHSVPFFGVKSPMLTDMIFETDETITKNQYTIIDKEKGTILAWTKGLTKEGNDRILWMKAMALHDTKGVFVAAIGSVKEITEDLGKQHLLQRVLPVWEDTSSPPTAPVRSSIFDKLLGKAKSSHKEGLRLYFREGKYAEAISCFDRVIESDPTMAYAWNDRGLCLRELGRDEEALRNFDTAVELMPAEEELLFTRAEMLMKIGIKRGQKNAIEAAVNGYNKVLAINPYQAEAWNSLGICMKELGKSELSRQYYDRSNDLVRFGSPRKKMRNFDTLV